MGIASGFRRCIVARPGHLLLEADFNGIEAVITGWCIKDPNYIRLAKLGVHAYLTSHLIAKPASLGWSDEKLGAYFKDIKNRYKADYDRAKRCVHGTNYGLTPHGMVNNYPESFTVGSARQIQGLYFDLCPRLKEWHNEVRHSAVANRYLGGNLHPYGYKHWFWDVAYKDDDSTLRLGSDSKRVVAFFPQSIAAGVLYESQLRLMSPSNPNYIGDMYVPTPIRALIHDSGLYEIPESRISEAAHKICGEMGQPIPELPCPPEWGIGPFLSVGVSAKAGPNWQDMADIEVAPGVAWDTIKEVDEDLDELDLTA